MTEYILIRKKKAAFLSNLEDKLSFAESQLPIISNAAINLQRCFRGKIDRNKIKYKSDNVLQIQRCFRGLMGRHKANNALDLYQAWKISCIHKYFVIQIQRCFRGYYSRKYKSNHSDRKKFIGDLEEIGRRVREMMYEYSTAQAMREEQDQKDEQDRQFEYYASNLHHLVSTRQIRGVFNPPKEYMIQPTWRDVPVEDHVRKTVRDLLRTRGVGKTGLITDINGVPKIPLRATKSRLSIQASAPYESLENDKREKSTLHRILTADKGGAWFAGGKTDVINHKIIPLNTGDPYVDANLNPLLKKGVPASQEQLLESGRTQKTLWQPPLERPFYVNSSGNKSSVYPNDLFDVIADAQESGGVTKRALGTSKRFGVPDSCDNRPPGAVLPEPPLRAYIARTSRPRVNKLKIRAKPVHLMEGAGTSDGFGLSGVVAYEKSSPTNASDELIGDETETENIPASMENDYGYVDSSDDEA